MANEIVEMTVAIIEDGIEECLYTDGKAWKAKGEVTVYAADIAEFADGRLIRFQHRAVKDPGSWPDNLADLEFVDGD